MTELGQVCVWLWRRLAFFDKNQITHVYSDDSLTLKSAYKTSHEWQIEYVYVDVIDDARNEV